MDRLEKVQNPAPPRSGLSRHPALGVLVVGLLLGPSPGGSGPAAAQEAGEGRAGGTTAAERVPSAAHGGAQGHRRLTAVPAPGPPPDVDGRLDEVAWAAAAVATDFVQLDPAPGAAPSQRTEVRLLYTADALYIGARMFDTRPDSIVGRLSRRDERPVADRFSVGLDSYHDRRTAFAFAVTAAGVQSDRLLHDDTREDRNWDAVWASAASVDSLGWVAELRIPVSQLRFNAPEDGTRGDTWGVNFEREIARLEETDQWAPYPEDRSRAVSAFGTLTGLRDLETPNHLEIRPYAVLRADRTPVGDDNPFRGSTETGLSLGGDASYGLGPNLTANVTVNPDFGQVEADPSVVNLSAFETFFPEKRPFFQEGADIFGFDLGTGPADGQLFYSRRIGRAPHGSAPADAPHSENPEATTILGAAKLSGKTSDGWSLGLLGALTAEEEVRYLTHGGDTSGGEIRSAVTEPLTSYGVARALKNFGDGESAVGAILTGTVRDVSAGGPTGLPGAAVAGGVDARVRFGGGDWEVDGHLLGSRVTGSSEAIGRLQTASARYFQRPDADHLAYEAARTSLSGLSANLALQRIGGHWRLGLRGQARTPGFEVNDLGFQPRADQILGSAYLQYLSLAPRGPFRSWGAYVNGWQGWTWGGERTYSTAAAGGNFQLRNLWSGFVGVELDGAVLSPTELRGGPALRRDAELGASGGIGTDPRRRVQIGLHASWGTELGTAGRRVAVGPTVAVQPADAARLTLQPTLSWNRDVSQYVSTVRDAGAVPRYLFGRLEQRTASLTARLDYTFSPDLSLQLYAEPFLSAGEYTEFREVRNPRAEAFEGRFHTYTDGEISEGAGGYAVDRDGDGAEDFGFGNPDFNVRRFRSNVVLRWEYAPGSRIFLVWSQDRSDSGPDGRFDLGRDLDGLFGAEPRNVFLVKVQHWLGM